MVDEQLLQKVREHIGRLKTSLQEVGENASLPGRVKITDHVVRLEEVDHEKYVQCADQHYFVARLLFLRHVYWYSRFCGQQCVENYLKAFIKWKGSTPNLTHDLTELRRDCVRVAGSHSFCEEALLDVVIAQYNGFNEFARYPTVRFAPGPNQETALATTWPSDIYVLDYFVYLMRRTIPLNPDGWDIFRDGHMDLVACERSFPEFYDIVKQDNVNF